MNDTIILLLCHPISKAVSGMFTSTTSNDDGRRLSSTGVKMILKLGGLAIVNTSLINSHFKGYIHK